MICRDTPTHGWVCGWLGGSVGQWMGSGHVTKYQINLDVIKIIQFCLKIYDLLRHPHLWVPLWQYPVCILNFTHKKHFCTITWVQSMMYAVAEPGFPQGGGATPQGGTNIQFGHIFPKTA